VGRRQYCSPIVAQFAIDTSEYPEEHTFYAFSSGTDTNPVILKVIDEIPEYGSRTIFQTVTRVLRSLASELKLEDDGHMTDDSVEMADDGTDEDEGALLDTDDEGFGLSIRKASSLVDLASLQWCGFRQQPLKYSLTSPVVTSSR
jgi:hypothetical protein